MSSPGSPKGECRRAQPEGTSMSARDPHTAGAVLTIDLDAIVANWRRLRSRIGGAECAAVLKADAYGLGAAQVGSALAAAGARPDALRPASSRPSQTIAKRSEPMPLLTGSTTVSVIAVATAASAALPPLASIESPACAASGWLVATTFRARTGCRRDG